MVLKSRQVLEFQMGGLKRAFFGQSSDDESDVTSHVDFDVGLWRAMGEPGVVTVSIEPGDGLNDEPDA
jgi:hypothetical protein